MMGMGGGYRSGPGRVGKLNLRLFWVDRGIGGLHYYKYSVLLLYR